jgi:uncharacterized membrane-anchored protein YhcB (DUF1043 family)
VAGSVVMIWLVAALGLVVSALALFIACGAALAGRAYHRALILALAQVDRETSATQTALEQIEELLLGRQKELERSTELIAALRHKYETTYKLYQESIAIDGPLGSRRLQ